MKNKLSALIFLISIIMLLTACKGPLSNGTIEYHPDQNNAVLSNTSTDEKITFIVEETCQPRPEADTLGNHTFKEETTISPQEQQIIGPMEDGVGTKWHYKIIGAYNANKQ